MTAPIDIWERKLKETTFNTNNSQWHSHRTKLENTIYLWRQYFQHNMLSQQHKFSFNSLSGYYPPGDALKGKLQDKKLIKLSMAFVITLQAYVGYI